MTKSEREIKEIKEIKELGEEMVTITKTEYDNLQQLVGILDFLYFRGVDNWEGFRYPPERADYETDEEYEKAYEDALDNY